VGVNARGILSQTQDGQVVWKSSTREAALPVAIGRELPNTALAALDAMTNAWTSPAIAGLPPLTSGLVGALGWDTIREIENLPSAPKRAFDSPLLIFTMVRDAIIMDHQTSKLLLVSNLFIDDESSIESQYDLAMSRLGDLRAALLTPSEPFIAELKEVLQHDTAANMTNQDFLAMVEKAKKYVEIGDVFQVVLSQRFDHATDASAMDIYRALRALNPSPYMYLLNFEDEGGKYAIIGSSPEALVKVSDGEATMHPIAGSRPRGTDWDHDLQLESSLLADAKERAEHLMLVDLARNDLLKVCEPTSVNVTEFMQVHKFSHIQHLVSTVEGTVLRNKSAVDVFKATFPAGTLSGAPKPRALEIIDELETDNRGLFGGVVGYFDFSGNADLAIAIRTVFLRDGIARVQAGAGIVLDSVPQSEADETKSKASAPLKAVLTADSFEKLSQ
jgi:anthranilate synthase component 1